MSIKKELALRTHYQSGVHRGGQAFARNIANVKSQVTVVHQKMIDEVSAYDVHGLKLMSDD